MKRFDPEVLRKLLLEYSSKIKDLSDFETFSQVLKEVLQESERKMESFEPQHRG